MNARRMTMLVLPLLVGVLLSAAGGAPQAGDPGVRLRAAVQKEEVDGDLQGAIGLYGNIVADHGGNRAVAAEALLRLGGCHEKLGQADARRAYERVLAEFPDQADKVQAARQRLAALGPSRPDVPVARRIHTGGGVPAVSPDGRYVVYMDGRGNYRLDDLRTGKDTPVTDDTLGTSWRFSFAPIAISPDSREVAYPRLVGETNELRVSSLDGSVTRVLHRKPNRVASVWATAWMPDGKELVVVENDGFDDTRGLLDAAGGPVQYVDEQKGLRFRRWGVPSPDGRYIAFEGTKEPSQEGPWDVYLYDVAGRRDVPIVSGSTDDRVVGWSPSGREVVFLRSRGPGRDVWSVAVEDGKAQGEPRLVKSDLGNGEPLLLGRNGVLYQSLFRQDVDAFVAEFDSSTGRVELPARTVNERRERSGSPRWSTDGRSLLYLAESGPPGGPWMLVVRSEASGVEQRVPVSRPLNYPQWLAPSPDGRVVAVEGFDEAYKDRTYGPLLIDPSRGVVDRMVGTACDISWKNGPIRLDLSWSPHGEALYYKCRAPEAKDVILVMRRDVATGAEQQVYRTSLYPGEIILSPDGARFAFKQRDPGGENRSVLVSMDVASGEKKELDRVPEFAEFQALAWSADSKRILYCRKQEGGSDLWWVPADGGAPERLAHLGQSIFTLAMDPAGKRIAWTAKSTTSEVWALENLLPR